MLAPMVRTQIQLTDDQAQALKDLASAEGTSMAELVRDGVDHLLRGRGVVDRAAVKARSIVALGRFKSAVRDLGTKHDDHLAEAFDA